MVDINGGDFQAPISPKWLDYSPPYPSGSSFGNKLFENVSHFYAWYLSWDSKPSNHTETFELLSRIMRIAQVSKEGGNFLSSFQEKDALEAFSDLSDDLSYGKLENPEINDRLNKILAHLTDNNPKAKVVSYITSLEYLINIRNADIIPKPLLEDFKAQFSSLIEKLNPNLSDINAEAISRHLKEILQSPPGRFEDILSEIKDMTKKWL
ncbi:MAG: hypothetical protein Tsb0015_00470 [Simkaniaceae bacterium]